MFSYLKEVYWDTNLPIYQIPHSELIREGIKGLLLDVDGTLLCRTSKKIPMPVKKWISKSKGIFTIYLISNNPSEKRISEIGNELGIRYKHRALKPSKRSTLEAIKILKEDNKNIALIGDRIFTDIFVGNRCKIKTILVKKLDKKGNPIRFNITLILERFFSYFIF
tara:strand:- start:6740 stop:7237 length:498 start_codon:yes stop_codon:yes gene_type:complete